MSSTQPQKGGDGVENQESMMQKLWRVAGTVLLWLALAVVAAIITAFVRDIPQLGLKGSLEAIWDNQLTTPPVDRRWWAHFMDWVILVVSLIVAVRIMYPPKDLHDTTL